MAQTNMVKFTCDCCKKEFLIDLEKSKKENPLKTVEMPSRNYDCEGRHYTAGTAKVELCGGCFTAYWRYVQDRYNVADGCSGMIVEKLEVR